LCIELVTFVAPPPHSRHDPAMTVEGPLDPFVTGEVTDGQLAFLAVRPALIRRSRPWWLALFRILEAGGNSAYVSDRGMAKVPNGGVMAKRTITSEIRGDRMADLVVACDIVAEALSPDERTVLRLTGALPEQFLADVLAEAETLKAERRRNRRHGAA
jgi:hypothetical protein